MATDIHLVDGYISRQCAVNAELKVFFTVFDDEIDTFLIF